MLCAWNRCRKACPVACLFGSFALGLMVREGAGAQSANTPSVRNLAPWRIQQRVFSQHNDPKPCWQADYLLELDPEGSPSVLAPGSVSVRVNGWVSNARVPGHEVSRRSELRFRGKRQESSAIEIIPSTDVNSRCQERGMLEIWPDDLDPACVDSFHRLVASAATLGSCEIVPLQIEPGERLHVRLRLEHDHFLYAPYEPLLGVRSLELRLGPARLDDRVPFERLLNTKPAIPRWPVLHPPAEYEDRQVCLTPPHSLRLTTDQPGGASFRYSGPVRYDTLMQLSFWYLLSDEASEPAQLRLSQLKQGPALWKPLGSGSKEEKLNQETRWTRVVRTFRTEPEATHLIVEFRLVGATGSLWIDDVHLEPLVQASNREP